MPKSRAYCCIEGCRNNRSNSLGIKFYSFPLRDYKREQREKWIKALKKKNKDGSPWLPSKHSIICSQHFIGNAKSDHPLSPSFVPTIFPSQMSGNAKSDNSQSFQSFVSSIFPQYQDQHRTESGQQNALSRGSPLQIIDYIVIEHDNNQMEVDDENPTMDHVQKPRQIIGVRLNKTPKTSAERAREFRARKALLKQQQEPDAIVEIVTEDIRCAGPSEDNQVLGPSEITTIEKRAKSVEATRRWREKNKDVSESSKKQAKTAAQRMREYRQRKKLVQRNSTKRTTENEMSIATDHLEVDQSRRFPDTLNQYTTNINPPIQQVLIKREPESTLLENSDRFETNIEPPILQIHHKHESIFSEGLNDFEIDFKPTIMQISQSAHEFTFPEQKGVSESSKKQAKTAAQRMREYRLRKKLIKRNSTKSTTENEMIITTDHLEVDQSRRFPDTLNQYTTHINPPIQQVLIKREPESTLLENSDRFETNIEPPILQVHHKHESIFSEGLNDFEMDFKPITLQISQSAHEFKFPEHLDDSDVDTKPNFIQISQIEHESTFPEHLDDSEIDIKPNIIEISQSEHESTFPGHLDDSEIDIKPNIIQIPKSEHESKFLVHLDDSEIDIKPNINQISQNEQESTFPEKSDDSEIDIKPKIVHIPHSDKTTQIDFLPNDADFDIFFCSLYQNENKCEAETQATFRDYETINGRKVIVRKVYDWYGKDVKICFD